MVDQETLAAWRQREVQALGAALSLRDWHMMEQAYNSLRDKMDRVIHAPTPKGGLPGRGEVKALAEYANQKFSEANDESQSCADRYAMDAAAGWDRVAEAYEDMRLRLVALAPAEAIRDGGEGGEG